MFANTARPRVAAWLTGGAKSSLEPMCFWAGSAARQAGVNRHNVTVATAAYAI